MRTPANSSKSYQYSEDWFSPRINNFSTYLKPLSGSPCKLLEVGTFEGRCTFWLVENIATHPRAQIETIDIVKSPLFAANLAQCAASNKISFTLGISYDRLRTLEKNEYDFVYIDGCHSTINVLEDAVLGFRTLRLGGILAFDDYLWNNEKFNQEGVPKPAVDAFLEIYKQKIELLEIGYQVWIRKMHE